ncbi:MAG: sulfopyruvate decarboxylase subunit alpha [Chloroflexi bacterium]|jgi:sulfopyruvate decarboxylase TPP-binding subunit|nr:MAG: sulfopyruvate decarboxylase subunit alpha [Chloroflexota bacterium]
MTMIAQSVAATELLEALLDAGVQDVVAVPDTHQRTLIASIEADPSMRFIQATTEDEGTAICAGLIVGGRRPILQIQHAGLYACVNNLRGLGIDGAFPIVLMVGLLSRDRAKAPQADFGSMVRLAEPLLDALEIPHHLIDGPADVGQIGAAYREAEQRGGPVALLIGAETV